MAAPKKKRELQKQLNEDRKDEESLESSEDEADQEVAPEQVSLMIYLSFTKSVRTDTRYSIFNLTFHHEVFFYMISFMQPLHLPLLYHFHFLCI